MTSNEPLSAGLSRSSGSLSLLYTLAEAYSILGRHFATFVILSVLLAIGSFGLPYLAERFIDRGAPETSAAISIAGAGILGGIALSELMCVLIGIVWFRVILLNEPHRSRSYLRFGRRELRYLGVDLLIAIVVLLALVVVGVVAAAINAGSEADMWWLGASGTPAIAGAIVLSTVWTAWLGLAYPAIATDACDSGSLRHSIHLSRGNRLRLFLAYLLGPVLWDIAALAMPLLATPSDYLQPVDFVSTLFSAVAVMCFIAVTAVAYRQLQGRSLADLAKAFD